MKTFPITSSNPHETNGNGEHSYKTLDELNFADLYVEVPEQDFSHIQQAINAAAGWMHDKWHPLHMPPTIKHHPHFHYPKFLHGIR